MSRTLWGQSLCSLLFAKLLTISLAGVTLCLLLLLLLLPPLPLSAAERSQCLLIWLPG